MDANNKLAGHQIIFCLKNVNIWYLIRWHKGIKMSWQFLSLDTAPLNDFLKNYEIVISVHQLTGYSHCFVCIISLITNEICTLQSYAWWYQLNEKVLFYCYKETTTMSMYWFQHNFQCITNQMKLFWSQKNIKCS